MQVNKTDLPTEGCSCFKSSSVTFLTYIFITKVLNKIKQTPT